MAGKVFVEAMDPGAVLDLVGNPAIADVAKKVRSKLQRVIERV